MVTLMKLSKKLGKKDPARTKKIYLLNIAASGPGIIVLLLLALIPIASKFYAKKITRRSNDFQRNYYTTLTIINLLLILVVLWMTLVIVHDRVLHDCC